MEELASDRCQERGRDRGRRMERKRKHSRALTETLRNPNADHVQFEQLIVHTLTLLDVHEEVIDEATAPWSH